MSTDPRVIASREKVLAATLELLSQSGLSGLSIDEVAKCSGVAKTTIYRHWGQPHGFDRRRLHPDDGR